MIKNLNSAFHIILQPFSGIGKKFISSLLEQYITEQRKVRLFYVNSMDYRLWDSYFNEIYSQKKIDFIIVVSSVFYRIFNKYLSESCVLESFNNSDRKLINHYIFTPGRNGELFEKNIAFIKSEIKKRVGENVIWQNDNIGTSFKKATKGNYLKLEDWPEFQDFSTFITSVIYLHKETYCFEKDLFSHIRSGESFNQAIFKNENNIIFRQRLFQIKRRTFRILKNANI